MGEIVSRFIRVSLLGLLLIFMGSWFAAAASWPGAVAWPELASHLEQEGVPIIDLPVIDCPLGLADETPSHLVVQIIENTFYEWKEYEFFTADGEIRLALEMVKPEARLLRADEAGILLNASRLCEPGTEPMPDESESELMRGAVIGSDDRVKVTDTTAFPWNNIVFIDVYSEFGEWWFYSGFLIGQYTALTTGWTLYDFDMKAWYGDFAVTPGQYYNDVEQWVEAPFGTIGGIGYTNGSFVGTGRPEYDYGALLLPEKFSGIDTFMALEFDYRPPGYINYAGYVHDEGGWSNYDMWSTYGTVTGYEGIDDRILKTTIDMTRGGYGGPLWVYNAETKTHRVVAIAIWNDDNPAYNSACRLVS